MVSGCAIPGFAIAGQHGLIAQRQHEGELHLLRISRVLLLEPILPILEGL
jgi:hypothetical protein